MANHKRGAWDTQVDGLMDINANLGNAHDDLTHLDTLDDAMDMHQEIAYRSLRVALRHVVNPTAKALLDRAIYHLTHAEKIETTMEEFLASGTNDVTLGRDQTVTLTVAAEEHRRESAAMSRLVA